MGPTERPAGELRRAGTQVLSFAVELVDVSAVAAAIASFEAEAGPVEALINNAGWDIAGNFVESDPETWRKVIDINLYGPLNVTRAVLPGMIEREWGRIINIASAHGLVASPFKSAYVAAKHGIVGLTKTVALEAAEFGVTCNAICPGYVLTPLVEKQIPDTAKARGISEEEVVRDVLLDAQATKQFVTVEQLGALAVFLCTDDAAQLTGAALPVDGGWTAH